ncbi:MAG: hypothetical protein A2V98_16450 [Planctomycetes bacterium RBG_16_64_12]|nr:MAG: hypothetical protein A2V98_16450 [Planctomycetes bacterium RBG_16_64_12]
MNSAAGLPDDPSSFRQSLRVDWSFRCLCFARLCGRACGTPIFVSTADLDYQAILATFKPIQELLDARPRMDMTLAPCACTASRE